jgi:phage tail-like protein
MAVGDRNDPFRGYNYRVEIDGLTVAGFSEASGLTLDTEPVEYREGNDVRMTARKLPGLRKFSNITLKRGYTPNMELFDWYKQNLNGAVERRDGAIALMNEVQEDVLRWKFEQGWICKYTGPTMTAASNDVTIETVELCVEWIELE